MKQNLALQIKNTKNQIDRTKPFSVRRRELGWKLRNLVTQALRKEIRDGRLTT